MILVHQGLAIATASPELALNEAEGQMLAKPTVDILEEFDLKPDPRFEKALALILACGFVYGPRTVLIRERLRKEAAERKANGMRSAGASSTAQPQPTAAAPGEVDPAVMAAAAASVAGAAG